MLLRKVVGRSVFKIQTTGPNRVKYSLKMRGSSIDDPLCQQLILIKNFCMRSPQFGLSEKNDAAQNGWRIFSSL